MTFDVLDQENLEELCREAPLPASINVITFKRLHISAKHVPFICHDGLNALHIYAEITFSKSSRGLFNRSTSTAKSMFGDRLSNSTSIETLDIMHPEICESFLPLIHRKPLLDCLKSLTLWKLRMNNKKMC